MDEDNEIPTIMINLKKLFSAMVLMASAISAFAASPVVIPLYDGAIPDNKPNVQNIEEAPGAPDTYYQKVCVPTLTICLPDKPNEAKSAVVICPGGGYEIVSYTFEGLRIAKALNDQGIAAFIVKYRTPNGKSSTKPYMAPIEDAQRAMKIVREHASQYGIDSHKIGVIGFSAGGHLAATVGVHYNEPTIENELGTSLRPDFMLLVYPVITFTDIPYIDEESRIALISKERNAKLDHWFSPELYVTDDTPPACIVQATDDNDVPVQNSIMFYEKLLQHKIPVEMHLYVHGNHGLMQKGGPSLDEWMGRCVGWMRVMGFVK
jgi:acetyl esterase/lipase